MNEGDHAQNGNGFTHIGQYRLLSTIRGVADIVTRSDCITILSSQGYGVQTVNRLLAVVLLYFAASGDGRGGVSFQVILTWWVGANRNPI